MNQQLQLIKDRQWAFKSIPGSSITRFLRASEEGKNFLIVNVEANARGAGIRTVPGADRIIQAGFCLLDSKFNVIESGDITVNPGPDTVTRYASLLTGIPDRKARRSAHFPAAFEMFLEMYQWRDVVLCCFGLGHLAHFAYEMELFGLESPDGLRHWLRNALDVQSAVSSVLGSKDGLPLEKVMERLDLDPIGHFHDAGTDSLHVFMILKDLFRNSV